MKFFKKPRIEIALLTLVACFSLVYAANFIQRFTMRGIEMYRLDTDGSLSIAGVFQSSGAVIGVGPWKRGNMGSGTGVTLPTTTTGSNFAAWVPVYNAGAAVTQGDVLIASNTGTGYVRVAPATLDLTNVVGVAAESIAATANGWMVPRGSGYAVVHGSGTIAIGDVLVSSGASSGYLWSDTTPTSGAQVAVAMSANTSGSGGSVLAIME